MYLLLNLSLLIKDYMTLIELRKKHPQILGNADLAIDVGWSWLLNTLCSQIEFDIRHNGYPQIEFSTVKEKFGALRIYYKGGNDIQRGMVQMACFMSSSICEKCGDNKTAKIRSSAWLKCLCSKCWVEEIE